MGKQFLLLNLVAILSFCCVVLAFEPSPMHDFCVADASSTGKWLSLQRSRVCWCRGLFLQWPIFVWKHIKHFWL
ncbi:hypothetical protein P3S67_022225 [Capsicum chacoense]